MELSDCGKDCVAHLHDERLFMGEMGSRSLHQKREMGHL